MDIDMLGITSNQEADIVAQVQDILTVDVETDGLAFDPASIQAERITEDADYEGIRLRWTAFYHPLSQSFLPVNKAPQTGQHPAHGPEPVDFHQKTHPNR
jgi:hypothetical protein